MIEGPHPGAGHFSSVEGVSAGVSNLSSKGRTDGLWMDAVSQAADGCHAAVQGYRQQVAFSDKAQDMPLQGAAAGAADSKAVLGLLRKHHTVAGGGLSLDCGSFVTASTLRPGASCNGAASPNATGIGDEPKSIAGTERIGPASHAKPDHDEQGPLDVHGATREPTLPEKLLGVHP